MSQFSAEMCLDYTRSQIKNVKQLIKNIKTMDSDILVPIFICAIMPVAIVFIVFWTARNNDNRRADILIKAIESGNNIDADKLAEALRKPQKSPRELVNSRLLRGCIFSLVGIALIAFGIFNFVCGSQFDTDNVSAVFALGGISLAVGISYLFVFRYTKRQLDKSEEAESNPE